MTIDPELFNRVYFSDYLVESINYDPNKKKMVINMDGIYIENLITDHSKKCKIDISAWEKFEIKEYNMHEWINLDINHLEPLDEICESTINLEHTILKGFGKISGQWIEYHFYKPNILIEVF
jgi:hypothetical protein